MSCAVFSVCCRIADSLRAGSCLAACCSRSPTPFVLSNVGKIPVFGFSPVNNTCNSFFRWTIFRLFEVSVRMGLKTMFVLCRCSVRFYPVRYPWYIGYHGKSNQVGMVVFGPDLAWAAFSMNLVRYPLSWT